VSLTDGKLLLITTGNGTEPTRIGSGTGIFKILRTGTEPGFLN